MGDDRDSLEETKFMPATLRNVVSSQCPRTHPQDTAVIRMGAVDAGARALPRLCGRHGDRPFGGLSQIPTVAVSQACLLFRGARPTRRRNGAGRCRALPAPRAARLESWGPALRQPPLEPVHFAQGWRLEVLQPSVASGDAASTGTFRAAGASLAKIWILKTGRSETRSQIRGLRAETPKIPSLRPDSCPGNVAFSR
jgi:hypothetical protein